MAEHKRTQTDALQLLGYCIHWVTVLSLFQHSHIIGLWDVRIYKYL